jgi:cytochrome c2
VVIRESEMREQFLGTISALLAIVTLAGARTPAAVRATALETVGVSRASGSVIKIEIRTKDATVPLVTTLPHPARIVVDLPNVLADHFEPIPIQMNGVKRVRIGTDFTAKTTRVVVDLVTLCRYELVAGSGHRLILKLDPSSPAPARASGEGAPATPSAPVRSASLSSRESAPSQSPPSQSVAGAGNQQTLAEARFSPRKEARAAPAAIPGGYAAEKFQEQSAGNVGRRESATPVKFSAEAAAIFNQRCTACHTYGKGIKVGPDLKGVTERRQRDWLRKFIHSSSQMIQSGNPTATALFAQFKQQRMPDWTDLSEKQISDILDYLSVGGPEIKPEDERNAETATAAETETGRKLFYGETRIQHGAPACASCHTVSGAGMRGGTLGPDLSDVYFRYQDVALTVFLLHPCFSWAATKPNVYLTATESFALKAFFRVAASKTPARAVTLASGGKLR